MSRFCLSHHVIPPGDAARNNVDNAVALCPNCRRQKHFWMPS
ncbi:HNH endonuclease [Thiomonas sp.]